MTDFAETFTEIGGQLWDIWKEMFGAFITYLPIAVKFLFWVILGIIVLPCVFVAGTIYPWWVDWGEKTF